MDRKSSRFEIRLPLDLGDQMDDWRRKQPDLPARAEAARRLIEIGLGAEPIAEEIARHLSVSPIASTEYFDGLLQKLRDLGKAR